MGSASEHSAKCHWEVPHVAESNSDGSRLCPALVCPGAGCAAARHCWPSDSSTAQCLPWLQLPRKGFPGCWSCSGSPSACAHTGGGTQEPSWWGSGLCPPQKWALVTPPLVGFCLRPFGLIPHLLQKLHSTSAARARPVPSLYKPSPWQGCGQGLHYPFISWDEAWALSALLPCWSFWLSYREKFRIVWSQITNPIFFFFSVLKLALPKLLWSSTLSPPLWCVLGEKEALTWAQRGHSVKVWPLVSWPGLYLGLQTWWWLGFVTRFWNPGVLRLHFD